MDFLFHKVSEKEKEEIKRQAKKIVDDFSKKLSKVAKMSEPVIEREEGERQEGDKCAEMDKKIMFENAPEKKEDFIIGEKGGW
tara:strand:+ start:176 stop:424 length:249 start_codon:yes stop_codon:yes gene_type:complete